MGSGIHSKALRLSQVPGSSLRQVHGQVRCHFHQLTFLHQQQSSYSEVRKPIQILLTLLRHLLRI